MGKGEVVRTDTPLGLGVEELEAKLEVMRSLITPTIQGNTELQNWCTKECLLRFLRARRLDPQKAAEKLNNTLQWRLSYKPDKIRWEEVREEARTGKTFILGQPDKSGRVIVLMRPRCENTKSAEQQIKFLVYSLELASRKADTAGNEKMTWLIDFEGYSMKNAPSPKVGIQTLHILQGHYPERLGLAICFHPPRLFSFMWKACSPFIDPVTYKKIHFVERGPSGQQTMEDFFHMDSLEKCMGGTSATSFDFDAYEKQQLAEDAQRKVPAATLSAA